MIVRRIALGGVILAGVLAAGCASDVGGNDGETHFVCAADPDCPSDEACVDGTCVPRDNGTPLPSDSGGSVDDAAPAPAVGCPTNLPGPALVFIPGERAFCIDAHEVRQNEYAAFLQATVIKSPEQSPECASNDRFEPIPVSGDEPRVPGSCAAGIFDPVDRGDYSMTCADWCDAKAYCEWAGKRLCGGLGALEETLETQTDPMVSEWQYACTNGAVYAFPYGAEYVSGKCIDANYPNAEIIPGGSPDCKGDSAPFDEIFDLAGHVMEWTAACDSTGDCSLQGGYYGDEQVSCASNAVGRMRATLPAVGFRCCANAI